jgi:uncharacterized PurR-regulated membrane protein YhhQ (DUF165 family)
MPLSPVRQYRYYDLILAAYVCILLCANLIGPSKVAALDVPVFGRVTFVAGVLFFPLSYIFGDILTEVYGYARDRRCVWAGFAALAFAAFMASVIVALPPAAEWREKQIHVQAVFGSTGASSAPRSLRSGAARWSTATCSPR